MLRNQYFLQKKKKGKCIKLKIDKLCLFHVFITLKYGLSFDKPLLLGCEVWDQCVKLFTVSILFMEQLFKTKKF